MDRKGRDSFLIRHPEPQAKDPFLIRHPEPQATDPFLIRHPEPRPVILSVSEGSFLNPSS
jgi:hypothetical protein